jgi:FAD/FMN-containing dehydrogenase
VEGRLTISIQAATERMQESFQGRLILPRHADYDRARAVWNGMIDRRPALIAQCAGSQDVALAIRFARENRLPVSVKGGGHGVAGKAVCDDGLTIDLSCMNAVEVDPNVRTARVEGGAIWRDVDSATQAFGLATTGGLISETGVGGLTLGGGIGYLARSHGLTIDNLTRAEVALADGTLVCACETEHPDLFWGLRGGGGGFGVVTSFEFQLHPVGPEVMAAQIFYPLQQARQVLRLYCGCSGSAPDELACYALFIHVPPIEAFPEKWHGKVALALVAVYAGGIDEGVKAMAPLQDFGSPILKIVQPTPYTALQQGFDQAAPKGGRYYWKSHFLNELSNGGIDVLIDHAEELPGEFTSMGIEPLGGAIRRTDPAATAYPHRDAAYALGIWSGWLDPGRDQEIIAWTQRFHEAMSPFATGGAYANYLDRDDFERLGSAFGQNYERLQKVKAKYDPSSFFSPKQ